MLKTGEHIFIGVALDGDKSGNMLCPGACEGPGITDRNYWSNATKAPYNWKTMKSFQVDVNYRFEAVGTP